MRYEIELERLATLDADAIARVCTIPGAAAELIDVALDECLDFAERADEFELGDAAEHAAYCRQEAAAWRATVALLRTIAAEVVAAPEGRRESGSA